MGVVVDFQGESLEFEVPSERVVASWRGPEGILPAQVASVIGDALEHPHDFPPLRQMIVPGDRVAIAIDPRIPRSELVLEALVRILEQSGVGSDTLTVVAPWVPTAGSDHFGSIGAAVEVHDPDDRARIAYLASTKQGRRVYLNRSLTDADVVVPVGLLRHDADAGYRGPWSVVFPDLSDRQTMQSLRARGAPASPEAERRRQEASVDESCEVSWLLGSQFFLGIVPGATGLAEVVAGREAAVRERGIAAVEQHWSLKAPSRAELVVAGVGRPEAAATLEDLAVALETAAGLVQHGGRIVLLSRASGPIGPALQRLMTADEPREALDALRGVEEADDYPIARRIARAAAWADLFVSSGLDAEIAESLPITPLERPEQARRLAASAGSVTFVSHADLTRAVVIDDS
jgi:lactate racemase